ncbi:MAG: Hsp20/alpha crystallin family protein [Anaeroplasma sp.]
MRNDFYDFVNELNNMFYTDGGYKSFPIDVVELPNSYEVTAELPGVKKEDIQITFEDGVLTIVAKQFVDKDKKYLIHERTGMKLKRTVNFGDIEEDTLKAKFENGLLIVTITTKQPEVKEKKSITIE